MVYVYPPEVFARTKTPSPRLRRLKVETTCVHSCLENVVDNGVRLMCYPFMVGGRSPAQSSKGFKPLGDMRMLNCNDPTKRGSLTKQVWTRKGRARRHGPSNDRQRRVSQCASLYDLTNHCAAAMVGIMSPSDMLRFLRAPQTQLQLAVPISIMQRQRLAHLPRVRHTFA